jgi:hypothetical protein
MKVFGLFDLRSNSPIWLMVLTMLISSCSEESDNAFDNPDLNPPIDTTLISDADPQSFIGLHQQILKPTCANSGCHDGNFEPDFRTIESAYNSLVYHPIIKNNPAGTYEYRVEPGNLAASILWLRLNEDIDGMSGIMPLTAAYDPESDWFQNKSTHLANISAWISQGAKDMFGNAPSAGNQQPGIEGIYAEADGVPCNFGERIYVPQGTQQLQVYLALIDAETPVQQFSTGKVRIAENQFEDFDTISTTLDLQVLSTAISKPDFFGNMAQFQHRVAIDMSLWNTNQPVYMRVFLKDPMQADTTQIPQDASLMHIKRYFSWQME